MSELGLRSTRRAFLRRLAVSSAGLGLVGACGMASPLQTAQPAKVVRIVFIFTRLTEPVVQQQIGITKEGLRALGYIEGQTITYEGRDAAGDATRFRALAAEVVALRPDVIICQNVQAALELKAATTTIPVVFVAINADPLEAGVVTSLARPGGNITGIGIAGAALASKRLQLLKEAAPSISRVAVIQDQGAPRQALSEMQTSAQSLGVEVLPIFIRNADELDAALASAVADRADALIHAAGFVTGTQTSARKIAEFAIQNRWPSVGISADLGGLINYNGVLVEPWRRAATFVDRILRGANPGEIPVEGPTGSTLVINMCTAARLGLSIPQSMLASATSVVQCSSRSP